MHMAILGDLFDERTCQVCTNGLPFVCCQRIWKCDILDCCKSHVSSNMCTLIFLLALLFYGWRGLPQQSSPFDSLDCTSSQVSCEMPVFFICHLKTSLKRNFCPSWLLLLWRSSEQNPAFYSLLLAIWRTCPAQWSCDMVITASTLTVWAWRSTAMSGIRSCHLMLRMEHR